MGKQPLVQLALLCGGRMQQVPHVRAASGRAQTRQPQLRAEAVRKLLERVELRHVLARDDDRELEPLEAGRRQVLHRADRGVERPLASDPVVYLSGRAVERDLHVDVVGPGNAARRSRT